MEGLHRKCNGRKMFQLKCGSKLFFQGFFVAIIVQRHVVMKLRTRSMYGHWNSFFEIELVLPIINVLCDVPAIRIVINAFI